MAELLMQCPLRFDNISLSMHVALLRVDLCLECDHRPLLVLGGVADALTEALSVLQGSDGMDAARAAEACTSALESLKLNMPSVGEDLLALD